ncbi:MAG: PfkB family carbohydrate kinase, partial [Pseudomonadota bacterium]
DEQALWDEQDPKETLSRIVDGGASTVVVKLGDNGALGWSGNNASLSVPCPETLEPVDTTAAGDSFNAGFLAAYIAGQDLEESISFAHDVAAAVIQHRGAIVPKAATAPLAERLRATA